MVNCSHVIEHVDKPFALMKELIRVSKRYVIIKCPHRYAVNAKFHMHKNVFNLKWFEQALTKIKETTPLIYQCKPNCRLFHSYLFQFQINLRFTAVFDIFELRYVVVRRVVGVVGVGLCLLLLGRGFLFLVLFLCRVLLVRRWFLLWRLCLLVCRQWSRR